MRKARAKKRILLPDPKFNNIVVTRFVNNLMLSGKKSTAFNIFYDAIEEVSDKTKEDGLEIWKKALVNVTPAVEVRSRRVGGATYQVPIEVPDARARSLAMKWIIEAARNRKGKNFIEKLGQEIIDAYRESGGAVKKKSRFNFVCV